VFVSFDEGMLAKTATTDLHAPNDLPVLVTRFMP